LKLTLGYCSGYPRASHFVFKIY